MINLAYQKRYDEAEPHDRRVVEERLDTLGPEHQATIEAQEALASFLSRRSE